MISNWTALGEWFMPGATPLMLADRVSSFLYIPSGAVGQDSR